MDSDGLPMQNVIDVVNNRPGEPLWTSLRGLTWLL